MGWRDIDTTLVKRADGSVSPAAVPGSLVLSGGGDSEELVKITDQAGRSVSLGAGLADVRLPAPELDGATATYPDVLAGVDVRVEVRRTGFELLWVVKDAVGAEALAEASDTGDEVRISAPLTLDKTSARLDANGSITFTSSKGKATGSFAVPSMWDSAGDLLSGRMARKPVRFGLTASGKDLTPADPAKSGKLALTVSADRLWLASPDRVFPIMIDPTYETGSSTVSFDTDVQTSYPDDRSGFTTLRLGKLDSTGSVSRTFMNIESGGLLGRTVMSGTLQLWELYAATCTPTAWSAYNAGLASTSTRWTSQPTIGTKYATSTATTGFGSGCAPGSVTIDMKSQLQNWASGSATTQGLLLRADNESSADGYKIFSSLEGAHPPVLTYTVNRVADTPVAPTVVGAVSYKPAGSSTAYLYSSSRKPKLSVSVSDPDANQVTATFQASTSSSFSSIASSCTSPVVASGSTATCTLGTELVADGRYYLRSRSTDTVGASSAWSPTRELRIAAVTPAAPVVTCPSPYTHGSWQTAVPGTPVTCTISATGSGYSAPSRILVSVDTNPVSTSYPITQSSAPGVASITVQVPNTSGGHSIRATAVTPTGLATGISHYLGWGSTPLLRGPHPAQPQVTTTDRVRLFASGKASTPPPTAKGQWRISGAADETGWKDLPAGNALTVTQPSGQFHAVGWFDTNEAPQV